MPDQKPTLDYGRPEPPHKDWKFDVAACVMCSIVGVGFLLSSGLPDIAYYNYDELIKPVCAVLSFWFAWRILKRR